MATPPETFFAVFAEEAHHLGEQGDAGDNGYPPVQWLVAFLCHSNPEKPLYACQTATRHVQR